MTTMSLAAKEGEQGIIVDSRQKSKVNGQKLMVMQFAKLWDALTKPIEDVRWPILEVDEHA